MKKLHKKSLLFNISLVIITIIVLTTALIALGQLSPFKDGIGSRAFDIVNVYQEAENRLFYVDESAGLSAQQAAYDLAQNGGYSDKPECNEYRDYAIWSDATAKECYPDDYKEGFKKIFNNNIKDYLSLLPFDKFIDFNEQFSVYPYSLPNINYEISFLDRRIIGIPNLPMQISFYYGAGDARPIIGNYKVVPSFNAEFDYDISMYEDLRQKSAELIKECTDKPISCVNNKALEYNWNIDVCGSNAEKVFSKFTEEYLDCVDSKDSDCYCEIEYLSKLEKNDGEDYEIILSKQDSMTKINLVGYGFEKIIDYKMLTWLEYYNTPGSAEEDINYHIYYNGQGDIEAVQLEPGAINYYIEPPYNWKARISRFLGCLNVQITIAGYNK